MNEMYRVMFSKRSQKALKKMDKQQSLIIMGWIKKNLVDCTNPRRYGKALSGNLSGAWRYRIGDYRIIAHIDDEKVTILMIDIGHRKDIYQ